MHPTPLAATLAAALLLGGCGARTPQPAQDSNAIASLPPVDDNLALAPLASMACTMQGIGSAPINIAEADAPTGYTVTAVSEGMADDVPYCQVQVRVDPTINIWITLPTGSNWNGRLRAEGGGGYAGSVGTAIDSARQGFVGVQTDTGHVAADGGSFGMMTVNGVNAANEQLQKDFAYRSEHLMAVLGKQYAQAFYGQEPLRAYWYGCSTGGRQGLRMAQDYPQDYDAILAGAPAINWDRFQAYQIWPQMVMRLDVGKPITAAKLSLVTARAVAVCDADDGVTDGVIDDPRNCSYDPRQDSEMTKAACSDDACLTPAEAGAVQKIWNGARDAEGNLLWPGLQRGAALGGLAGANPFGIAVQQPQYWVYFDPSWDWTTLTYDNYAQFFSRTVERVGPLMASNNPDLRAFRQRGGKLIMYHGWADNLIMPEGTVRYYDAVKQEMGASAEDFALLYMVPGMGHCSGGAGPNSFGQRSSVDVPQTPDRDIFRALMAWSEKGSAPKSITATLIRDGSTLRTRPLCPYPQVARYNGSGSTDEAGNFACKVPQ